MSKLVLFGTGDIAQLAHHYFETDSPHTVAAFAVDGDYKTGDTFDGKPLVAFEDVAKGYPPGEYSMFVALSYAQQNRLREAKYDAARAIGYSLESYISSKCSYLTKEPPGPNAFILEENTVQPFVRIGANVTLWSGNHIGHHSTIEDHNFISSQVALSGRCTIKPHCFLGVNCTIAHGVTVSEGNIIGAGAVIARDTEANAVYVPPRSTKLDKPADQVKL
jgi:sugar O-acyltransferase (sialic acid O-acetyltransferase NeuD family)